MVVVVSRQPLILVCLQNESESQHHAVQDFDWIKATPSPNWSKLPDEESEALNRAVTVATATLDDDDLLGSVKRREERLAALRTLLPVDS